jgi:hypothetical protein
MLDRPCEADPKSTNGSGIPRCCVRVARPQKKTAVIAYTTPDPCTTLVRCSPSPAPPGVSPGGIVGFHRRERVLRGDELEGQAAAAEDRATLNGTALKTFEQQNRLTLKKTNVHSDISFGDG